MISVEKFINVIHEQLLEPLLIMSWGFTPRYSTQLADFEPLFAWPYTKLAPGRMAGRCIWWHEEPLNYVELDRIRYHDIYAPETISSISAEYTVAPGPPEQPGMHSFAYDTNFHLFANSEKSSLKSEFLKSWKVYDWYFFFHGFAALDWFNDYKYLDFSHHKITKVFICLNHLITNNRSYRLNLLSHIKQRNLHTSGFVSAPLLTKDVIKKELSDSDSRLSLSTKKHILNHLARDAEPMVLDTCDYNKASASINDEFVYGALWNVVTETIFYDNKLHLTEKIFKPIVSKRPFILVAAPGNLAYLKSYGFQTFDQWIDESYDSETDPDLRIKMIADQLEKLCQLSHNELILMYQEMQAVLDFNYTHFYGKFKEIIINELIDNFEVCTKQYNLGLSDRFKLPTELVNLDKVKAVLLQ
jgi:hypothetical protein